MEEDLRKQRDKKLAELVEKGVGVYENNFKPSHHAADIVNNFEAMDGKDASVAGRLTAIRKHGKAAFMNLLDSSGKIQLYFKLDMVGKENFELLDLFDIGDIIGAGGKVFKTHKGEITVAVENFTYLVKSLHPLPEKWHGLQDVETRYRQRYLDLICSEHARGIFTKRSRILKEIRNFLDAREFLEVETPMLQTLPGGAAAKPFKTHHNTLDMDLYLRIAPELYLKRLLVGGFERVYEINRNFRNEGISTWHNPEFTMIEVYQAYGDMNSMMELTESLLVELAKEVCGALELPFMGHIITLAPPFQRKTYNALLEQETGKDPMMLSTGECKKIANEKHVKIDDDMTKWDILAEIFDKKIQDALIQPTFVVDFPTDISPLAKRKKDAPELTERFELFVGGHEMANAFSELNDPVDQRKRLESQLAAVQGKDDEIKALDEDFLLALEHGMPPTGGLGIGIDRLVMLLTNAPSIREVIFFPTLRPEK